MISGKELQVIADEMVMKAADELWKQRISICVVLGTAHGSGAVASYGDQEMLAAHLLRSVESMLSRLPGTPEPPAPAKA